MVPEGVYVLQQHTDHTCVGLFWAACFCFSPEMWHTSGGCLCYFSLFVCLFWSGDPLYIVKIIIGPVICIVLLLIVSITGFFLFKKRCVTITSCSALCFYLASVFISKCVVFLFVGLVKLKGPVVPFTPLQTPSISVLMTVSEGFESFNQWRKSCIYKQISAFYSKHGPRRLVGNGVRVKFCLMFKINN